MSIFTQKDYNSSNGFQSSVFGPAVWFTLHMISFNYPIKPTQADKENYTNFLMSFEHTLPCIYCRNNFKSNLKKAKFHPKVMESRATFSKFIYDLHNCVNEMLGKTVKITYAEVRDRYEHFRSRCSEKKEMKKEKKEMKKEKKHTKEKGCNDSLYGKKSKCIIEIVPKTSVKNTFKMHDKCKASKKTKNDKI